MYQNYSYNRPTTMVPQMAPQTTAQMAQNNPNDERFIGGFVFPFLLGGVTGAALAPNFWRPPYNRPPYYPYPPYYGPYYR